MLLSEYVRTVIADEDHYTKQMIQVDPTLIQRLGRLRDLSEEAIQELGLFLRWQPQVGRVLTSDMIAGARTVVDWNPGWFTAQDYVGTAHTHPYRKKLGPTAEIGFSFQDFDFYAKQYPLHLPLSVNFVISNTKLFLAVFREITVKHVSDRLFRELNTDEAEADEYIKGQGRWQEALQVAEDVARLANEGHIEESATVERNFYTSMPGYLPLRVDANKRMMRTAAQRMRFELYEGTLGHTLHLKSHRVYAK